jgi:hypothetical protein
MEETNMGKVIDHGTPIRYAVKRKTYRGREGFLVYTSARHKCDRVWCTYQFRNERFFCRTEVEARRMRDDLARGLEPQFDAQQEGSEQKNPEVTQ